MSTSYQIYALNDGGVNPMMINELSTYGDLHVGGDLYVDGNIIGGGGSTSAVWTPASPVAWVPLTDTNGNITLLETDVYHNPTMEYSLQIGQHPMVGCTGCNRIYFKTADGSDSCFLDVVHDDSSEVVMYHGDDESGAFWFVKEDVVVATSWTFPQGDWVWDKDRTIITDTVAGLAFWPFTMPVTPKPTVVKLMDLLPPTSSESASDYKLTAIISDRLELSFKWTRPVTQVAN
jgi:hypothetical protein